MIYTLPFIASFIGYATNWLAVKMLFRPRRPRRIFGLTIQGVFPKRQAALAENLGKIIARDLLSKEDILSGIDRARIEDRVLSELKKKITEFFDNRLISVFPMLSMFLSSDNIKKIKESLSAEIRKSLGRIIDSAIDEIGEGVDVKEIVALKIQRFSSERLEVILLEVMKREFQIIEILGAIIGFIIGLIQFVLIHLG